MASTTQRRRRSAALVCALAVALAAVPLAIVATIAPASAATEEADPLAGWPEPPDGTTIVEDPRSVPELNTEGWSSTWEEIAFDVRSDGSFVAAYAFRDGVIVGQVDGPYLIGWWCETNAGVVSDGQAQFRLIDGPEGVEIQGRWTFDISTSWGTWNATPLGVPPAAVLQDRLRVAEQLCESPFGPIGTAPLTIDTPSSLSALPTVQSVTPIGAAAAGGGAIVLVAIAAYPAVLLDGTLTANRERLFGWAKRPTKQLRRWGRAVGGKTPAWLGVTLGLIATVVLSGFIEPRFGFNLGSARLLTSLAISIVVERLLFLLLARRVMRRAAPELTPTVTFAVSSLLFVAVAVLLTRVTGFEPGIVFGLVLGIAVASDLTRLGDARLALAASSWALVLGLIGWVGYSILVAVLGTDPPAVGLFAIETLSGFAVAGIAALPIALLPLGVLDGGAIWAWRKTVWVAAYLIGLTAFLVVVLPMPTSWGQVSSTYIWWIVLYGVFCLLAIGLWAAFRFIGRPLPESAAEEAGAAETPTG